MNVPGLRFQRTLKRPARIAGVSFFTNWEVEVEFRPAPANAGITFHRDDLPGSPPIPALIEFNEPCERRTRLRNGEASVELTEHVMAAFAGLEIDNCEVHLSGPELPGLDGSSAPFAEVLLRAGTRMQSATRSSLTLTQPVRVVSEDGEAELQAIPSHWQCYQLLYELDYGPEAPIEPQEFCVSVTQDNFLSELAPARTFVLEAEVNALRSRGIGRLISAKDLLVFGEDGPIDNALRLPNECARHKALDCLGDLALLGCDLIAEVSASRSGHRMNLDFVRELRRLYPETAPQPRAA